jgi:hypothetical protein
MYTYEKKRSKKKTYFLCDQFEDRYKEQLFLSLKTKHELIQSKKDLKVILKYVLSYIGLRIENYTSLLAMVRKFARNRQFSFDSRPKLIIKSQ